MPRRLVKPTVSIFSALSAPTRLETLKILVTKGPLAYSEIMEALKMEPTKDAGKFAYHLRNLTSTGLIEWESGTKTYRISELGVMLINVSQNIDEYSLKKKGKLLVRTSKYALEEFNRAKISKALVEEAEAPPTLADKIAAEAEERLLKLSVKYLTAPLIREFVNAILIERGLEEYRHKLTRLGMPVYDVTRNIKEATRRNLTSHWIQTSAGNQVLAEYTLLHALPNTVADAHLSGAIHICDPGSWILKPSTIFHDTRTLLQRGLEVGSTEPLSSNINHPSDLYEATLLLLTLLDRYGVEVVNGQILDFFNIFLAPFVKGLSEDKVRRVIAGFLTHISHRIGPKGVGVTLGLELGVPEYLREVHAVGAGGKEEGDYGNFEEEGRLLLKVILEEVGEMGKRHPLFAPHLLVKVRRGQLSRETHDLLLSAHEIAARYGTIWIANLIPDWQRKASYGAQGERVGDDWVGEWDIDTVRTASLGKVTINVPRLAFTAHGNEGRLLKDLEQALNWAMEALEIKRRMIERRGVEGLLAHLFRPVNGEAYLRVKSSQGAVSLLGLREAAKIYTNYYPEEDLTSQNFALRIVEHLSALIKEGGKGEERPVALSLVSDDEASRRLLALDVERYGQSILPPPAEGGEAHYSNLTLIPPQVEIPQKDRFSIEGRFHSLASGGHFTPITPPEDGGAASLVKETKELCENYELGLFAYNFPLALCSNCNVTYKGSRPKCPRCGSTNLINFRRVSPIHAPFP